MITYRNDQNNKDIILSNNRQNIMLTADEKSESVNVYCAKINPRTKEITSKKLILNLDIDPKKLGDTLDNPDKHGFRIYDNSTISCYIEGSDLIIDDSNAKALYFKDLDIGVENKKSLSSSFYYSTLSNQSILAFFQSIRIDGFEPQKRLRAVKYKVPASENSEKFTLTMIDLKDKKEFLLQYPYTTYKFQVNDKGLIVHAQEIAQTLNGKVHRKDIDDPELAQKIFFSAYDKVDSALKEKVGCFITFAYKNYQFKAQPTPRLILRPDDLKMRHFSHPKRKNSILDKLLILYQSFSDYLKSYNSDKRKKEVLGKWSKRKAQQELFAHIRSQNTKLN